MTSNFEFVDASPSLQVYYKDCENVELSFANKLYVDCYCGVKRLIEAMTYNACMDFNIPIERAANDDFILAAQWNNPEWMRFINEKSLIKDIKAFIKNRNKIEHVDANDGFTINEDEAIDSLQYLRDFLVILLFEYDNIDIPYDKIEKPKNQTTEKLKKTIKERDDALKSAEDVKKRAEKEKAKEAEKRKKAEEEKAEETKKRKEAETIASSASKIANEETEKRKKAEAEADTEKSKREKAESENQELKEELKKKKPTIVLSNKLEYGIRTEL